MCVLRLGGSVGSLEKNIGIYRFLNTAFRDVKYVFTILKGIKRKA